MEFLAGRPNIEKGGEERRARTNQNDSLRGAVVIAVGPWPVGDLKGGHGDGSRRGGLKKLKMVEMAVSDPEKKEGEVV